MLIFVFFHVLDMKIKHVLRKGYNTVLLVMNLLFSQQRLLCSAVECSSNCVYFLLICRFKSNKLLCHREQVL